MKQADETGNRHSDRLGQKVAEGSGNIRVKSRLRRVTLRTGVRNQPMRWRGGGGREIDDPHYSLIGCVDGVV
jgi:hypothetical protein